MKPRVWSRHMHRAGVEKWELEIVLDDEEFEDCYTDAECEEVIACLFPNGFSGADVRSEIAPEGWKRSALYFVFHPTIEQVYQESVQLHRNMAALRRRNASTQPEPTLEEVRATYQDGPCDETREIRELVANCLWDVFSDGHKVRDRRRKHVHLGSFRGAGDFLAECLNRQRGKSQYGYMDFYMGTVWVSRRADLTPVYEMIFRRLKECSLDWQYHFPELHLTDFHPEERDAAERRELEKMRADMKRARREAVEEAKLQLVPEIVVAYTNIYDTFPHGWPPWEFVQEDD